MLPKTCYCINLDCKQPDFPSNLQHNFCNICGSNLLLNKKYRVKRLLSDDSGFGNIYEAESNQLKILKVLKPEYNNNSKVIDLFKQEYQVLLNLTQQKVTGIPQVEKGDYFQYQTKKRSILHCFVMEKVEGINLEQWVKNNGEISQKQALKWLKEITQILGEIHQQNYFHRDIKPANIMQRFNGELVLIDFGTAREETQTYYQKLPQKNITQISSVGYTPEEQKIGKAIMQSDFFALGRTFVYLLTGKHPLDMYDAYHNVLKWHNYTQNINPLLLDFIDKLMAFAAKDRPLNTNIILAELNKLETQIKSSQTPSQPQIQSTATNYVNQGLKPYSIAKANFSKLEQYLAQSKWQEADQETVNVMCKIMGREKEGWLTEENCQNFPREALKIIDELWLKYSNGKFGFSVQKKIWLECGGKVGQYDYNVYQKLAEKIGWFQEGNWLDYSQLNFTINAPHAHLPVCGKVVGGWVGWWRKGGIGSSLFSRL